MKNFNILLLIIVTGLILRISYMTRHEIKQFKLSENVRCYYTGGNGEPVKNLSCYLIDKGVELEPLKEVVYGTYGK